MNQAATNNNEVAPGYLIYRVLEISPDQVSEPMAGFQNQDQQNKSHDVIFETLLFETQPLYL